jgi:hypothetical protein
VVAVSAWYFSERAEVSINDYKPGLQLVRDALALAGEDEAWAEWRQRAEAWLSAQPPNGVNDDGRVYGPPERVMQAEARGEVWPG